MKIENKYQPLLLESLEDLMYKVSLELEKFKGQPMTKKRKELTQELKTWKLCNTWFLILGCIKTSKLRWCLIF